MAIWVCRAQDNIKTGGYGLHVAGDGTCYIQLTSYHDFQGSKVVRYQLEPVMINSSCCVGWWTV